MWNRIIVFTVVITSHSFYSERISRFFFLELPSIWDLITRPNRQNIMADLQCESHRYLAEHVSLCYFTTTPITMITAIHFL